MIFEFTGVLQRSAGNQHIVTLPAATLGEAVAQLTALHPPVSRVLLDNTGQLRRAHRLFLNGELVQRPSGGLRLADEDRIAFLTAIAGG
jgi:sulfur-carrier protein